MEDQTPQSETPRGETPTMPAGATPTGAATGAGERPPSWSGQQPSAAPGSPYPPYPPYPYASPYGPPVATAPRRTGPPWYLWLIGGCLALVAITVIGCVVAGGIFAGLAISSLHQESATDTSSQTLPVTGTPTLIINNGNGRVTINAGGNNAVGIQITRVARAGTQQEAQQDLSHIQVSATQQGQTITISTNFTEGGGLLNNDREVDLAITAPARTNARITEGAGTVELDDISGALQVTTNAGDIQMSGVTFADGSRIQAQVGDVTVRGALASGAALGVQLSAGDVHLTLPATTSAHLTATTDAGNITVSGWQIGPPSGQNASQSLSGDLSPTPGTTPSGQASGTITMHVDAGDITVDQG